jgi:hypothetical protein
MARFDHLIDKYFSDEASRAIARAEVAKYENVPGMEAQIPGLLRMYAF